MQLNEKRLIKTAFDTRILPDCRYILADDVQEIERLIRAFDSEEDLWDIALPLGEIKQLYDRPFTNTDSDGTYYRYAYQVMNPLRIRSGIIRGRVEKRGRNSNRR